MDPRTLIIVFQKRIAMRYQEWWPEALQKGLSGHFRSVVLLGDIRLDDASASGFSSEAAALKHEVRQMEVYYEYVRHLPGESILLHCDLSFPGVFHPLLMLRRPSRSVVFCHGSSQNRYDYFTPVKKQKWPSEKLNAGLYDAVVVASDYHARKLGFKNCVNLGALPEAPATFARRVEERDIQWGSVARPSKQKVNLGVERHVAELSGQEVVRQRHTSWGEYFEFLDRTKFLLVTASEETYGYQITEAVSRGCVPIAPRAYSYPELLPDGLLYNPLGTVKDRAAEIISIASRWSGPVVLKNQNKIDSFWTNLIAVLKG